MRRVLWLALFAAGARAEDAPPTPEAINAAIDAGVAWLKSAQKEDGSWGACFAGGAYGGGAGGKCYHLGPTAFSIFTLTVCGVPRNDPAIQRGVAWLGKARPFADQYSSYESSALILMLTALNGAEVPKKLVRSENGRKPPKGSRFPAGDWRWMQERLEHLLACQGSGGFGYWDHDPDLPAHAERYADVSATQFAALALRAASFAGYPVPKEAWGRMAEYHRRLQDPSGGFRYHAPFKPSRGMTAAGLSTLIICREQIALLGEKEPETLAATIDGGFSYLGANFDAASNPSPHFEGHDHYHYCHLYAIERAGMLSGRREFGGKAWYARGAAFLVKDQAPTGRWTDTTCMDPEDILGTCFALLFLKKATIPVVTRGG